ncbi:alpha/beta hydrolase [Paenibacillus sp. GP183]|uniref:alpha/beta hydrolase n=1 Tax=Paenibacillus sp. GP183 TaxID=1882751 RepID=UPI000897E249|nr:alpha/beta hydrolase [Paenibacillus sp. GP183]SEB50899.1 Lysophospholipase, alpha-beta hydrolase superfamily [Paenibacillus sp. GP183]
MNTLSTDFQMFTARDGAKLPYRYFGGPSDCVLIFLHGITEPSLYLRELGQYVAKHNLATVYLPDLRGYGDNPIRRGDIDYIGQLDDDIDDLFRHVQARHPDSRIILGGHSAGGATALRQTIRPIHKDIHAYLLLSPALSPNSPLERKDGNGNESKVNVTKYVLLMALNALGIHQFDHTVVYRRLTPPEKLHGTESCNLSYRLALSRMVDNQYAKYLSRLTQPTFVLIGEDDEVFRADAYEQIYSKYCNAEVRVIPGHNHDAVVTTSEAHTIVGQWLQKVLEN